MSTRILATASGTSEFVRLEIATIIFPIIRNTISAIANAIAK